METGLYETIMAMKHAAKKHFNALADDHLSRYITNRNKRTGQTWVVIDRYVTNGNGQRVDDDPGHWGYNRAIIINEHGERIRIFHDMTHWRTA